jgi:putative transposase
MFTVHEKTLVGEEGSMPLTLDELAREGARRILVAALEKEVAAYLEQHQGELDEQGHRLVVRNGRAQPRRVTLGAGTVQVQAPRVDDRRVDEAGQRRQRFTSQILPPYMRRSPKVAEVLPILYLRGLSTGDFREALPVLLGEEASGLSPTTITRLTAAWEAEYRGFCESSLTERDYVYLWADGVHFRVRLEEDRLCTLVLIGVRPDGTKELVAVEDGYRESEESWATLLRGLKRRGMKAPVVAVGDGALGFWAAVREVWPETREQRCWVHRLVNVLDKLPSGCNPRPSRRCTRSSMPRVGSTPSRASTASRRSTRPSTRRPSPRCARTRTSCSPSSTCRPSTGSTYGPPMSSSRRSPPYACASASPRAPARGSRRW